VLITNPNYPIGHTVADFLENECVNQIPIIIDGVFGVAKIDGNIYIFSEDDGRFFEPFKIESSDLPILKERLIYIKSLLDIDPKTNKVKIKSSNCKLYEHDKFPVNITRSSKDDVHIEVIDKRLSAYWINSLISVVEQAMNIDSIIDKYIEGL
jgi:hypothetical protein